MGGGKKKTRFQKDPSWNFYYCPYILRTGEVCNQRCYDPKGCKVHRNFRQVPCKECGKETRLDMTIAIHMQKNIDRGNIIIGKSRLSWLRRRYW